MYQHFFLKSVLFRKIPESLSSHGRCLHCPIAQHRSQLGQGRMLCTALHQHVVGDSWISMSRRRDDHVAVVGGGLVSDCFTKCGCVCTSQGRVGPRWREQGLCYRLYNNTQDGRESSRNGRDTNNNVTL